VPGPTPSRFNPLGYFATVSCVSLKPRKGQRTEPRQEVADQVSGANRSAEAPIKHRTIPPRESISDLSPASEHSQGGAQRSEQYLDGAQRAIQSGSDSREADGEYGRFEPGYSRPVLLGWGPRFPSWRRPDCCRGIFRISLARSTSSAEARAWITITVGLRMPLSR